jgi:hypothetical protein
MGGEEQTKRGRDERWNQSLPSSGQDVDGTSYGNWRSSEAHLNLKRSIRQSISDMLKVSRTPVRGLLQLTAEAFGIGTKA